MQALVLLQTGFSLLKRPLAFLIAGYVALVLLALALCVGVSLLEATVPILFRPLSASFPSLSPSVTFNFPIFAIPRLPSLATFLPSLCYIPLISHWASCPLRGPSPPLSDLADIQASSFDRLRNTSVAGSGLALDISRLGAISLPGLISMIQHSNITGRDALIDALSDVADQAPLTSRSIQQFGSAVEEGLAVYVLDYSESEFLFTYFIRIRQRSRDEQGCYAPHRCWFTRLVVDLEKSGT